MNARRRTVPDGLPSRVYIKSGSYYWFEKGGRWIKLCRVDDGRRKMHERLAAEMKGREGATGIGNVPKLVDEYIAAKKHEHREKRWSTYGNPVKEDFADINISDVDAGYVDEFLENNWSDKLPMKRTMRSFLKAFFQWCKVKRYMKGENPCAGMRIPKPPSRDVYITNDHFDLIRAQLQKQPMILCLVDLCYLTVQRSTEIRDLRWRKISDKTPNWIDRDAGVIHFLPSKTRESSGLAIDWPITPDIDAALELARTSGKVKGTYVLHTRAGRVWSSASALRIWVEACERAGLAQYGYTIKDIRAKALTDAERSGYTLKELQVAAVHTDPKTTEIYMKDRRVPVSSVRLKIPKSA
jgi:integrase